MKRRQFIRTSTAAASTLGFGNFLYLRAETKGANDKISLALIGCGGRGMSTAPGCCKRHPVLQLKTVCDPNRTRLAKAAQSVEKDFGSAPNAVEDMRTIFDDKSVDAVWIATWEHWHMPAAIRACQAGKDVYVEKNPSLNIFEGRQLVKAAAKYDRIVQVGFQNRSAAYAFSARDYIKSGKLGKIVTVKSYNMLNYGGNKFTVTPEEPVPDDLNWDLWLGPAPMQPYRKSTFGGRDRYWFLGGGTLSDDASHVMDLARLVIGDPPHPKSVYGWGTKQINGGDSQTPQFQEITYDFGDFVMTCSNGGVTSYMTKTPGKIRGDKTLFPNWRNNSTRTEIYGTEGLMYLGRHGGGWQVLGKNNEIVAEGGGTFPDQEHQANFVEALQRRSKPNGDAEQCHRSAVLVHLGNIAYRVGNKQLLFDGEKERFTNDDKANELARGTYREGYSVPENV
ncbi:MAG: Gfo/Idh/MocA family oxidoreductase [Planctomycetaceae bacterium]|jgi:predicted dehydrogenase|nr:Gfo/Idh/MocA family oxidoreductase [Planctomycetaceae bacterium]